MGSSLPVLIVGAGPTGLMMAITLAHQGVPFRIIDRKSEPTQTTNAAGIHPRTIEIFNQMGISQQFIEAGVCCHNLEMQSEGRILAQLRLDQVNSLYNFILMLPQSETEKLLSQHLESLNVKIERSTELIDLVIKERKALATLKYSDERDEIVEADWVIGCDGYHSTVREKSDIKMVGTDIPQEFLVADIRIQSEVPPDTIVMFFTQGTILGLFPLKGNKYRMVANSNQLENKKSFSEEEIKTIVKSHTSGKCEVTEILWASPFWIHSKIAESLRKNNIFIAGDAAHVHSPAGAQGMNTGLQDAFNLGWKLALIYRNQANQSLLDSYQAERYPIMKKLVNFTEKLSHLALTKNSFIINVRNFFFKHIAGKSTYIQNRAAALVTQLSLNYENSPIVEKNTRGRSKSPRPGDRAPNVIIQDDLTLFSYLDNTKHNLLLFAGDNTNQSLQMLINVCQWVEESVGNVVETHIVINRPVDVKSLILDKDMLVHQKYQVTSPSMCLVRPDRYIGLFMGEVNQALLQSYLKRIGIHLN